MLDICNRHNYPQTKSLAAFLVVGVDYDAWSLRYMTKSQKKTPRSPFEFFVVLGAKSYHRGVGMDA